MAKSVDRRARRTRQALHAALMSLIQRKGYDATTVQDIIDAADVGRSTFYSHYGGKEDLLRRGFETLRALLIETQRNAIPGAAGRVPMGFSRAFFEHAGEYKQVYRALVGRRGGVIVLNEIRRVLAEIVKTELSPAHGDATPLELRVQFVVATFITAMAWWLERCPSLAATEADAVFRQLAFSGIGKSRRGADPGLRLGQRH